MLSMAISQVICLGASWPELFQVVEEKKVFVLYLLWLLKLVCFSIVIFSLVYYNLLECVI